MLGKLLEFILGPTGYGVNLAVFVAHEVEFSNADGYGFGAKAQETANIDHGHCAAPLPWRWEIVPIFSSSPP